MTEVNFHQIGRAIFTSCPEYFQKLQNNLNKLQSQALNDTELIPALYESYCIINGPCPGDIDVVRCNIKVVEHHRLFIAVVYYLYDPIFFKDCSRRCKDRLHSTTAHTLNYPPEWISSILPSIKAEYRHLKWFKEVVQQLSASNRCLKIGNKTIVTSHPDMNTAYSWSQKISTFI